MATGVLSETVNVIGIVPAAEKSVLTYADVGSPGVICENVIVPPGPDVPAGLIVTKPAVVGHAIAAHASTGRSPLRNIFILYLRSTSDLRSCPAPPRRPDWRDRAVG